MPKLVFIKAKVTRSVRRWLYARAKEHNLSGDQMLAEIVTTLADAAKKRSAK